MIDEPTFSDPAAAMLLLLARHLRPDLEADLVSGRSVLRVRHAERVIEVDVAVPVSPAFMQTRYRNTSSARLYGSLGREEAAAKEIRAELRAEL